MPSRSIVVVVIAITLGGAPHRSRGVVGAGDGDAQIVDRHPGVEESAFADKVRQVGKDRGLPVGGRALHLGDEPFIVGVPPVEFDVEPVRWGSRVRAGPRRGIGSNRRLQIDRGGWRERLAGGQHHDGCCDGRTEKK